MSLVLQPKPQEAIPLTHASDLIEDDFCLKNRREVLLNMLHQHRITHIWVQVAHVDLEISLLPLFWIVGAALLLVEAGWEWCLVKWVWLCDLHRAGPAKLSHL
jgi:hypothetical protein